MKLLGLPLDGNVNDTPHIKLTRAAFGAAYGLLGGTAFVTTATFVDILLNTDLPLAMDFNLLAVRWLLIAFGLALVGALTLWWNEIWSGLGSGAMTAGFLALASALYASNVSINMKLVVLVFALVPIAIVCLPIAWILRWLVVKHWQFTDLNRSFIFKAGLIAIVLALGAGPGYFMKMSPRALISTRYVHTLLQTTADEKNPIHAIQGVPDHADMAYKLYQKKSDSSTEGFDIRAEYDDGYEIKCTIVLYPGMDPYLESCQSAP